MGLLRSRGEPVREQPARLEPLFVKYRDAAAKSPSWSKIPLAYVAHIEISRLGEGRSNGAGKFLIVTTGGRKITAEVGSIRGADRGELGKVSVPLTTFVLGGAPAVREIFQENLESALREATSRASRDGENEFQALQRKRWGLAHPDPDAPWTQREQDAEDLDELESSYAARRPNPRIVELKQALADWDRADHARACSYAEAN